MVSYYGVAIAAHYYVQFCKFNEIRSRAINSSSPSYMFRYAHKHLWYSPGYRLENITMIRDLRNDINGLGKWHLTRFRYIIPFYAMEAH